MATPFTEIGQYVRAILADTDSERQLYSDSTIAQHIRLQIMVRNDLSIQEGSPQGNFSKDLSMTQKAQIVFSVAKGLISQVPNYFAYATPVQSVTRSGQTIQLLAWIQGMLDKANGGTLVMSTDDEFKALIQGPDRFLTSFRGALGGAVLATGSP